MVFSASGVLKVLLQRFGPVDDEVLPSREETQLGSCVAAIIEEAVLGRMEMFEEEDVTVDGSLEEDPEWCFDNQLPELEDMKVGQSGESFIRFSDTLVSVTKVQEALEYYRKPASGCRTYESMASRFRFIRSKHYLQKLREFEKHGILLEDRRTQLKMLSNKLAEVVQMKLNNGTSLHDFDLRILALKLNRENQYLQDFKASHTWLQKCKQANRLCSRRVTKFVTKRNLSSQDQIKKNATEFVDSVRKILANGHPVTALANADQSGIQKELHSARALANVDEKRIERIAQSAAGLTHSFTVMPLLFADGSLGEKMFVVLAEPNGVFPNSGHFSPPNLVVRAHTSHIMTKSLMFECFRTCVFDSNMPNKLVLLVDSWNGFRDAAAIQRMVPAANALEMLTIPPEATGLVQPLDLFFFGPFKKFIRRINSYIVANDVDFPISRRDNILKTVSSIFHQFRAPRFKGFLQYSWHSGNYIIGPSAPFLTPVQFCFEVDAILPLMDNVILIDSPSQGEEYVISRDVCNFSTITEHTPEQSAVDIVWYSNVIVLPIIAFIGLTCDLLNILILTSNRGARRMPSWTLLFALAVCDCVFLVFAVLDVTPMSITTLAFHEYFNRIYYHSVLYIRTIASTFYKTSVLVVVAFNVERFICVIYPLKSPSVCTGKTSRMAIYTCFLISLLCSLQWPLCNDIHPCYDASTDSEYFLVLLKENDALRFYYRCMDYIALFGFNILPIVSLLVMNYWIILTLKKVAVEDQRREEETTRLANGALVQEPSHHKPQVRLKNAATKPKTVKNRPTVSYFTQAPRFMKKKKKFIVAALYALKTSPYSRPNKICVPQFMYICGLMFSFIPLGYIQLGLEMHLKVCIGSKSWAFLKQVVSVPNFNLGFCFSCLAVQLYQIREPKQIYVPLYMFLAIVPISIAGCLVSCFVEYNCMECTLNPDPSLSSYLLSLAMFSQIAVISHHWTKLDRPPTTIAMSTVLITEIILGLSFAVPLVIWQLPAFYAVISAWIFTNMIIILYYCYICLKYAKILYRFQKRSQLVAEFSRAKPYEVRFEREE